LSSVQDAIDLADLIREKGTTTPCMSAPDLWFPERNNLARGDNSTTIMAKKLCKMDCPVLAECLTFALKHDEDEGIWGGMNLIERRQLKRSLSDRRNTLKTQETEK
jgi:WhiB family redox-sensing transcriptional regulator